MQHYAPKSSNAMSVSLLDLPDELLEQISHSLDSTSVFAFIQCCRKLHSICEFAIYTCLLFRDSTDDFTSLLEKVKNNKRIADSVRALKFDCRKPVADKYASYLVPVLPNLRELDINSPPADYESEAEHEDYWTENDLGYVDMVYDLNKVLVDALPPTSQQLPLETCELFPLFLNKDLITGEN